MPIAFDTLAAEHGIHVIDTGFQRDRFDAAYLLVADGRAAFIDTGTRMALPRLLDALARAGLGRDAVDHVVLTHVHLDHAGGAGALMAELPQARLVVHPRGARHMVDPRVLYAGARQVYGEAEMARSYGDPVPVEAGRVTTTHDGMTLVLGASRTLVFLETPGHALHHDCIWDAASRSVFAGDTFGISYREFDVDGRPWIFPTTTPVQFDPEALKASVRRLLALRPARVGLTHFGPVDDVARLGALLIGLIDAMVEAARAAPAGDGRHAVLKDALAALYLRSLREHGWPGTDAEALDLLALDLELNAQGLAVWLDREARPARA